MFFTEADLRAADFRGADLNGSILNYADLRWTWFDDATLISAKFWSADLRGASFENANLDQANFGGANLDDVEDLTARQLSTALIDETTILPVALQNDPWILARIADCVAWKLTDPPRRVPPPTSPPAIS